MSDSSQGVINRTFERERERNKDEVEGQNL
jgi:hypothetical protein